MSQGSDDIAGVGCETLAVASLLSMGEAGAVESKGIACDCKQEFRETDVLSDVAGFQALLTTTRQEFLLRRRR